MTALATLIWAAASQLNVDVNSLVAQLVVVVIAFGCIILAAGVFLLLRRALFGARGGKASREYLNAASKSDVEDSEIV